MFSNLNQKSNLDQATWWTSSPNMLHLLQILNILDLRISNDAPFGIIEVFGSKMPIHRFAPFIRPPEGAELSVCLLAINIKFITDLNPSIRSL